jgi:hypothetical protein
MLGTTWAAKCKWNPDGGSDSASVASSESAHTEKMDKAAAAQAKKDAAAKAKAEKAAEKEKAKADAAAKKAEEKEAAAAAKKATATKKPAAKKDAAPTVSTSNVVADTSAPVATVEGELEIIGHTMYWVRDGNVYEYDEDAKTAGDFIGRKNDDGTIDEDADEVVDAEESDSE